MVVFALLADPKRGGQRAVGSVESFEQRREVALAEIYLREARGASVAREVRNQPVDDLLLARAEAERLAHALLLEEQVRDDVAGSDRAARPVHSSTSSSVASASPNWLSAIAPLRRPPPDQDRRRPLFRAREMTGEERGAFVRRVRRRQRAADRAVQHLALMSDEAVVADFLGQRVREPVRDVGATDVRRTRPAASAAAIADRRSTSAGATSASSA